MHSKMYWQGAILLLTLLLTTVNAAPIVSVCPMTGETFVGDNVNRCIYYWCVNGNFLPYQFPCAERAGVPLAFISGRNPCSETNSQCRGGVAASFPVSSSRRLSGVASRRTTYIPVPGTPVTMAPVTMSPVTMGPVVTSSPVTVTVVVPVATQVFGNHHIIGGRFQLGISDVSKCLQACVSDVLCQGFDFNVTGSTCWLHDATTECTALVVKLGCIHYRIATCTAVMTPGPTPAPTAAPTAASTAAPTTPAPTAVPTAAPTAAPTTAMPVTAAPTASPTMAPVIPVLPTVTISFPGFHILGGTLVMGVTDLTSCLAACTGTCMGLDFNFQFNMCFRHTAMTECNMLIPKSACSHFRTTNMCATPAPAVTSAPTAAPTAAPTTAAPTTVAPTTATPSTTPAGYLSVLTGMHILGGTVIASNVNEMQCRDMCLMLPACLAVDYNSAERTCWQHSTTTYCNTPTAKATCTHYQRLTCSTTLANNFVQALYQFHVLGGTQISQGVPLVSCLSMCQADATCQGVDYDNRTLSCWRHTTTTVCTTPQAKAFCSHYRRMACVITTTPAPIPAPTLSPTQTVTINFATPTVLPSGWAAYPGVNIPTGLFQGLVANGDACLASCAASATCLSFDFNANNAGCWFHTTTTNCNTLQSAPAVYHAKKLPVCTVDNSGNGYPIPTTINP